MRISNALLAVGARGELLSLPIPIESRLGLRAPTSERNPMPVDRLLHPIPSIVHPVRFQVRLAAPGWDQCPTTRPAESALSLAASSPSPASIHRRRIRSLQ